MMRWRVQTLTRWMILKGEVVEGLVEKMDHFGDEVEGLGDEIEGLVDEVENFGDDVESLGNDEVACSVDDDTEGVKDVQMERKEQGVGEHK